MRREALVEAVITIVQDLDTTGMFAMIEKLARRSTKDAAESGVSLPVIGAYIDRASRYDSVTKEVAAVMGIDPAADFSFWQRNLKEIDPRDITTIWRSASQALEFLPKISQLLQRSYAPIESEHKAKSGVLDEHEVQTIILTDEDGNNQSSPERLICLLSAVSHLYDLIAELRGVKTESIAVVGMDSGSEKSFDFLGVSSIIKEVRETFTFLYNALFFHKHTVTAKSIGIIADSLPLLDHIKALEDSSAINGEQASRLRHGILNSLEKFVDAGAYLPEMKRISVTPPSLLMKPQPKLLTAPVGSAVTQAEAVEEVTPEPTSDDFTPEQLRRIAQMMKESNRTDEAEASPAAPAKRKRNPQPPEGDQG